MAKIVFYEIHPWEETHLKDRLKGDLVFYATGVSKDELPCDTDAEIISVFVDSTIDGAVLDALPRLRFITTRSTGFDHIDHVSCAARGVRVATVSSYGENTVSEYTFALILSLSRKIIEGYTLSRDRMSRKRRASGL